MAYFPSAIQRWLDTSGKPMAHLEQAAGIPNGAIYRYIHGTNLPRPEALAKICQAVDEKTARDFLESYLLDSCPAEYRDQVQVIVAAGDSGSIGEASADYAKDKFTRALEWLAKVGRHNPEIVKHIVGFHALMTGEK